MPARRGKNYRAAAEKIGTAAYTPELAVSAVRESSTAKFDATIEAHVRLGVDPRHAEQMVRSTVSLPHGTGKTLTIAVFAQGEKAKEALDAGADIVGGEDLVKKVQEGTIDFDVCIATPDVMGLVGRLGKVLGPKGLMPNPKAGTVTFDIAKAVKDVQGGRVEFRVDRAGIIHCGIGKASFDDNQLRENFAAFMDSVMRAKPSSLKGTYVKSVTLAATMGPPVKVDATAASRLTAA
jgi:large subunit ribosomal protein L1